MTLSLEQARTIVRVALETRVEMGLRPLAVAVLDERGSLVAYEQEDGSTLLRERVARGKAMGALGMGMSSRRLGALGNERPMFMQALIDASGGQLVPVPGGVIVKTPEGHLFGAVGVSGDTSDKDEAVAVAGIEAAGLVAKVD
ncbi:MAG: heme-binding protein [Rhodospirillaceae bacterium]|nr:heme-binding protein [Rhodospirillaceae bacterium]MYB14880.1 heme-binding protein [Rhodospirillaceae bacterium]MYI48041.1 heme-binding protein [Rhodospirillaceae bacterium]